METGLNDLKFYEAMLRKKVCEERKADSWLRIGRVGEGKHPAIRWVLLVLCDTTSSSGPLESPE